MRKPPFNMVRRLSPKEASSVELWWSRLDAAKQQELAQLYKESKGQDIIVSLYAGKKAKPSTGEVWVHELSGLYEYLVNHEIHLLEQKLHIGGTCQRHPIAKTILESSLLHKTFRCPLSASDCPMCSLLHYFPGEDVRFFLVFRRLLDVS